jgi:23S rRNA (cytidine1920-2'-O)/16S rRNA (cytidine1409-2'-O)-methyltransferase
MTRLDQALVERGLCESREKAKRAVLAGQVRINTQPARKPGEPVKAGDALALMAAEKYVSRGGHKLEHALRYFQLHVSGSIVLDLGASTGGFTDCLLQHGAAQVYAVDVGRGQLAWKLRQDPRVVVMEKTNARFLTPEKICHPGAPASCRRAGEEMNPAGKMPAPPGADLITIDCSFISLRQILPAAIPLLKPGGKIIALVKPQFEAGKAEADRGRGVIRDAAIHERVLEELRKFVAVQSGLRWRNVVESPLLGPAGNKEFLVLIEKER